MTTDTSHSTHNPAAEGDLPQEPESMPYGKVAIVGVITLVIFAVGIVWSTAILNDTAKEMRPNATERSGDIPAALYQPEIGIVNQRMFELDDRAEQKRDDQLKRLHSYGWVDAEKHVAHIPIERAMEMMVSEQKK